MSDAALDRLLSPRMTAPGLIRLLLRRTGAGARVSS